MRLFSDTDNFPIAQTRQSYRDENYLQRSGLCPYRLISQQQRFKRLDQPIGRVKRKFNRRVRQRTVIDT